MDKTHTNSSALEAYNAAEKATLYQERSNFRKASQYHQEASQLLEQAMNDTCEPQSLGSLLFLSEHFKNQSVFEQAMYTYEANRNESKTSIDEISENDRNHQTKAHRNKTLEKSVVEAKWYSDSPMEISQTYFSKKKSNTKNDNKNDNKNENKNDNKNDNHESIKGINNEDGSNKHDGIVNEQLLHKDNHNKEIEQNSDIKNELPHILINDSIDNRYHQNDVTPSQQMKNSTNEIAGSSRNMLKEGTKNASTDAKYRDVRAGSGLPSLKIPSNSISLSNDDSSVSFLRNELNSLFIRPWEHFQVQLEKNSAVSPQIKELFQQIFYKTRSNLGILMEIAQSKEPGITTSPASSSMVVSQNNSSFSSSMTNIAPSDGNELSQKINSLSQHLQSIQMMRLKQKVKELEKMLEHERTEKEKEKQEKERIHRKYRQKWDKLKQKISQTPSGKKNSEESPRDSNNQQDS